ncbi:helix-turn-helix transcriptional regulator [Streptomyces sp. HSW2009]|uniref:helix-turn-helix domain-containing protein n=1 Tax=Streptomyces sp. HSW2009 TaxID=3142890 RepID=UPI0032F08B42
MSDGEPRKGTAGSDGAAYFGEEVRALRESLGLSQDQFAIKIHYNQPQISRVECGAVLASAAFAEAVDKAAGTPGTYLRMRNRLAKQGHPIWFLPYATVEKIARSISGYSNSFLMGLVQTRRYAEAVIRAAYPRVTDAEIEAQVETRLARQEIMKQESPPLLWMIAHEAALRTEVGSPEIMAEQLTRLADDASSPHVNVQVLPNDAGAPAAKVSFILVDRDQPEPKLYSEPFGYGHLTQDPETLREAGATYDRLRASALSPERSIQLIRRIAKEFST